MELMEQFSGEELKDAVKDHLDDLIPKHIIVDDIMASINYLNALAFGVGTADDIDHLGNRRLRCVGELLQNQFRIGFSRTGACHPGADDHSGPGHRHSPVPHQYPACHRLHQGVLRLLPLSQFMDQTNPLAELTHKRRLSALGPGGLSRDRACLDVRDIHYSQLWPPVPR